MKLLIKIIIQIYHTLRRERRLVRKWEGASCVKDAKLSRDGVKRAGLLAGGTDRLGLGAMVTAVHMFSSPSIAIIVPHHRRRLMSLLVGEQRSLGQASLVAG